MDERLLGLHNKGYAFFSKPQTDTTDRSVPRCLLQRETGFKRKLNAVPKVLQWAAEDKLVLKDHEEMLCQLPAITTRSTFLMVFSPDGKRVASTHGNHNIYVTDLTSGKNINTLSGHPRTPWCIAFHPSSNQILASGCLGGQVRVWDLHGGSEMWITKSQTVIASIAFHPTERMLVIATYNELYFWDWSQPEPYAKCHTSNEKEKVRYVSFDPLGCKLITGISNAPPVVSQWDRCAAPTCPGNQPESRTSGTSTTSSGPPTDNVQRISVCYRSLVEQYEQLVQRYYRLTHSRATPTMDRGTDPMDVDSGTYTSRLQLNDEEPTGLGSSSSRTRGITRNLIRYRQMQAAARAVHRQRMRDSATVPPSEDTVDVQGPPEPFTPLDEDDPLFAEAPNAPIPVRITARHRDDPTTRERLINAPPTVPGWTYHLPTPRRDYTEPNHNRLSMSVAEIINRRFPPPAATSSPASSPTPTDWPRTPPPGGSPTASNGNEESRSETRNRAHIRTYEVNQPGPILPTFSSQTDNEPLGPAELQSPNSAALPTLVEPVFSSPETNASDVYVTTLVPADTTWPSPDRPRRFFVSQRSAFQRQTPRITPQSSLRSALDSIRRSPGRLSRHYHRRSLPPLIPPPPPLLSLDHYSPRTSAANPVPPLIPIPASLEGEASRPDTRTRQRQDSVADIGVRYGIQLLSRHIDNMQRLCRARLEILQLQQIRRMWEDLQRQIRSLHVAVRDSNLPLTLDSAAEASTGVPLPPDPEQIASRLANTYRWPTTETQRPSSLRGTAQPTRSTSSRASLVTSTTGSNPAGAPDEPFNFDPVVPSTSRERLSARRLGILHSRLQHNLRHPRQDALPSARYRSDPRRPGTAWRHYTGKRPGLESHSGRHHHRSHRRATAECSTQASDEGGAGRGRSYRAALLLSAASLARSSRRVPPGTNGSEAAAGHGTVTAETAVASETSGQEAVSRPGASNGSGDRREGEPTATAATGNESERPLPPFQRNPNQGRTTSEALRAMISRLEALVRQQREERGLNPATQQQNPESTRPDSLPASERRSQTRQSTRLSAEERLTTALHNEEYESGRLYRSAVEGRRGNDDEGWELARETTRLRARQVLSLMVESLTQFFEENGLSSNTPHAVLDDQIYNLFILLQLALELTDLLLAQLASTRRELEHQWIHRLRSPVALDASRPMFQPSARRGDVTLNRAGRAEPEVNPTRPEPLANTTLTEASRYRPLPFMDFRLEPSRTEPVGSSTRTETPANPASNRSMTRNRSHPFWRGESVNRTRPEPPANATSTETSANPARAELPVDPPAAERWVGPWCTEQCLNPTMPADSTEARASRDSHSLHVIMRRYMTDSDVEDEELPIHRRERGESPASERVPPPTPLLSAARPSRNPPPNRVRPEERSPEAQEYMMRVHRYQNRYQRSPEPSSTLPVPRVHLNDVLVVDTSELNPGRSGPQSPPNPRRWHGLTQHDPAAGGTWRSRFLHPRYRLEPTVRERMADPFGSAESFNFIRGSGLTPEHVVVTESSPITPMMPNHRIQAWDFSTTDIPNISNVDKNIVAAECKIHNDASVDVSSDGLLLVTLLPSGRLSMTTMLGIYSLQWRTLGQCLYTTSFEQNAVSVSLSPVSRHLLVGLASRRVGLIPSDRHTMAQIFRLDGARPGPGPSVRGRLCHLRDIEQGREMPFMSINCIRWAPHPGQGFVYGTNNGQLNVLR